MHSSHTNGLDSPRTWVSVCLAVPVSAADESWDRGIRHSHSNNNN